ncbi:MAG: SAM-dependent methyltransferase [Desulfuromonas sp.]|uniref:class I SAM-dependent methyltransferase n=1 Tax=Desulfuromonas sp. TaxID=892 RepID=UPI000CAF5474|nr:class I SAM-dependent methyltransferase [Desulfuromonas sp.]PLX86702.1 MAG: SAM-dependent methyltransferase [Desulfuromonas sp.]
MQTIQNEIRRHLPRSGEARRLFHGRGQTFEGYADLTIDSFAPVVLVVLYRERSQKWLDELTELLLAELPETEAVLLQERCRAGAPSRLLWGTLPETVEALEEGLRYRLRLGEAQNIGFFPDMAAGRRLVRERAEGKRVLNLFAYSCSFSVAALAGGAQQVVNLDMNRGALELGRLNHRINGLDPRRASFLSLELFRSFGRLRRLGPFDLVVCDPPATQGKSFTAESHWPKLVRRLPELLSGEGEVLACLSTPHLLPAFLDGLFAELVPRARLLGSHDAGPGFPEARPGQGLAIQHYRLGKPA